MSISIKTYNQKAEALGERQVNEKVFALKVNEALIHQAMVAQTSNERQVLAHTKDRSEVRGGGRKPWAQKGTGRARAGSSRSPIWKGGGVTFGPSSDRNFKKGLNKKMKRNALCMLLSDRVTNERMFILDKFDIKDFKTKEVDSIMQGFEKLVAKNDKDAKKVKRSFLIINDISDEKLKYSARNLEGIKMINLNNINIVDLMKYNNLLITEKSVEALEKVYANKKD
jgi:large subunit ribosomal protein L4